MKLLFNFMSTVSFIGIVSVAAGGTYVYLNKDVIVDNVRQQVIEAATGAISDGLAEGLGGDLPISGGDSEALPLPLPAVPF
jgi:hypothetical protein